MRGQGWSERVVNGVVKCCGSGWSSAQLRWTVEVVGRYFQVGLDGWIPQEVEHASRPGGPSRLPRLPG